ncbi:DUF2914 domain-containing protein [Halomonas sp. 18H]|uniref:DUF2914 domain-containing protein n=1 Tax=Halomonas almeriensis TaxID=308163 RepID=UPI00222F9274|nr:MULTISPECIES: DUF2914 domain-containing protein [Halomonas]MCW4151489.1 DUF2914 domain-containing protein [Halomonas sp. 18H]MDN3552631.1 DUF2914 domain-containing protein [Halomonas almeriensis]
MTPDPHPASPEPPGHEASRGATRLGFWEARIEWLTEKARPWSWLWPPIAFMAGVGSFFLVERQQWLGAMLALSMLLTWCLLLSESLIGRFLSRRGYPTLPRGVTTFIAQMVHQETLFFTLPFLLATTVWTSGQAVFTLSMAALALLSVLDPLYYKLAEQKRSLYFAFHAQCVFLVVLVSLPTLLHLTTGQSLLLALLATVIFSMPSLMQVLRPMTVRRWLLMLALLPLLAGIAWASRVWVPPASLWISGSALSPSFNVEARSPEGSLQLTPEALARRGLYAYTAIHAPRGLREEVVHEWRHQGELIDRIPLEIQGGRAEGYRAWTHKRNFPEDSAGQWRIDVMTASGQRIGVLRFNVAGNKGKATLADGRISAPPGLPGLNLRALIARPDSRDASEETPSVEKRPTTAEQGQ